MSVGVEGWYDKAEIGCGNFVGKQRAVFNCLFESAPDVVATGYILAKRVDNVVDDSERVLGAVETRLGQDFEYVL